MNADEDWFKFATYNWTYLKKIPTIPPSRPRPLVRAGISVCSVIPHCQKYIKFEEQKNEIIKWKVSLEWSRFECFKIINKCRGKFECLIYEMLLIN